MATSHLPRVPDKSDVVHQRILLSDIISALSYALDLTEGYPMGHAMKTCVIGMQLAQLLQLSEKQQADLYYALLLKDSGCSNNAERVYQIFGEDDRKIKRGMKAINWTEMSWESLNYLRRNMMPGRSVFERAWALLAMAVNHDKHTTEICNLRCERGSEIACRMGFPEETCAAIANIDEHWDGKGYPKGLRGQEIPLLSRIVNLCQTLEVFATLRGPSAGLRILEQRSGKWFDPELVRAAKELEKNQLLWNTLQSDTARDLVLKMLPASAVWCVDDARLDSICEAFAEVIDAKSPYTYQHSHGVAAVAVQIAEKVGLPRDTVDMVRRASLLHDIGKLSVPNTILDKPGRLTAQEWEVVRLHPYYTQRILEQIAGFQDLAFIASAHHEKLDGTGYYRNLRADQLPLSARLIAVADVYDALSARRAYREALSQDRVLTMMAQDVPHALDGPCFEALKGCLENWNANGFCGLPIRHHFG
ncbi:MAG: HD domain-containing protein [Acidobacteria bacterium]|nr:HD domain-containing protein [Acidobacteriota bacterium]